MSETVNEETGEVAEWGKSIYARLHGAMKDLGVIGKGQTNTFHKFKFRGIDDALNFARPVLLKHQIILAFNVINSKVEWIEQDEGKGTFLAQMDVEISFIAPDGSYVKNTLHGSDVDKTGAAGNKAMAAAFKYGIFFGLCVPVDVKSLPDGDQDRGGAGGKKAAGKSKAKFTLPDDKDLKAMADAGDREGLLALYTKAEAAGMPAATLGVIKKHGLQAKLNSEKE